MTFGSGRIVRSMSPRKNPRCPILSNNSSSGSGTEEFETLPILRVRVSISGARSWMALCAPPRYASPIAFRSQHLAILGRTGTGKSSLIQHLVRQDIAEDRGFVLFDLHGELTPDILRVIAQQQRERKTNLSHRVLVIDPTDREYAVGLNILAAHTVSDRYVAIAEVTQILKRRWRLDSLGAPHRRTLAKRIISALRKPPHARRASPIADISRFPFRVSRP